MNQKSTQEVRNIKRNYWNKLKKMQIKFGAEINKTTNQKRLRQLVLRKKQHNWETFPETDLPGDREGLTGKCAPVGLSRVSGRGPRARCHGRKGPPRHICSQPPHSSEWGADGEEQACSVLKTTGHFSTGCQSRFFQFSHFLLPPLGREGRISGN